jgi:hypothetical protein
VQNPGNCTIQKYGKKNEKSIEKQKMLKTNQTGLQS